MSRSLQILAMCLGLWIGLVLVLASSVGWQSFKPLLKKAGLPDIRFHDLRHTCATLLLSRGHHAKLVQELLGTSPWP